MYVYFCLVISDDAVDRINLPAELHEISPFICPTLYDSHLIMETTSIFDTAKVPKRLQAVSEQINKYMTEHYSAAQMMTQMYVDFEALYKVGSGAAATTGGAGGGVMAGGSVATGTSFISKASSSTPGANASLLSSSVQSSEPKSYMAKHAKTSEGVPISEHEFRFR